jgi:Macrocin-O-methyltransferase (TylF)
MTVRSLARETLQQLHLLKSYRRAKKSYHRAKKSYRRTKSRLKRRFFPAQPLFYTLSPDLLIAIHSCFRKASTLGICAHSDYMEFGVYRGFSLWYAQALSRDMEIADMRFFGFDSFKGLPVLKGKDKNGDFQKGMFKSSRPFVEKNLDHYGVDWKRTFLVEGYYSESLNENTKKEHRFRECAVCVIDCDLYEATRDVLNFVGPLLGEKAFIVFDDWNCYQADPERGERKAFSEFLERNPVIRTTSQEMFGANCQVFLIEKTCVPREAVSKRSFESFISTSGKKLT